MQKQETIAFIDGQNLYMGTKSAPISWTVDFFRFYKYLKEKYKVATAYYYIGYLINENKSLYQKIKAAGFILIFRKHQIKMIGKKKGNVDTEIIFDVMKKLYKKEIFNKIILVSGDGDFHMLVNFLIKENRFKKLLLPNQKYTSSLYKFINPKYISNLDNKDIRKKISTQKKEGAP